MEGKRNIRHGINRTSKSGFFNSLYSNVQAAKIQLLVSYMLSRGITKCKALYDIT